VIPALLRGTAENICCDFWNMPQSALHCLRFALRVLRTLLREIFFCEGIEHISIRFVASSRWVALCALGRLHWILDRFGVGVVLGHVDALFPNAIDCAEAR
jgi:hypothetical protein